jgi:cell division septation protein DedD
MSKIKLALDVVSDLRSLAGSIETLVQSMEESEPVTTEEPEKETKRKSKTTTKTKAKETPTEKQPTLEDVRAAMAEKSRDGHREAVKAIITKYGANNLSSLDPKHYAAALKEAGELK